MKLNYQEVVGEGDLIAGGMLCIWSGSIGRHRWAAFFSPPVTTSWNLQKPPKKAAQPRPMGWPTARGWSKGGGWRGVVAWMLTAISFNGRNRRERRMLLHAACPACWAGRLWTALSRAVGKRKWNAKKKLRLVVEAENNGGLHAAICEMGRFHAATFFRGIPRWTKKSSLSQQSPEMVSSWSRSAK